MMDIKDLQMWAGTDEALASYMLMLKKAQGAPVDANMMASEEKETPRLLTKIGNVGVVSIRGPLNNSASWMNRYFGATGYPEIREALTAAATDPDIGAVLLDINSGGGTVSGMSDTAELIQMIDKKVKPVTTFSDGAIASAAYMLGSSARKVYIGKMTEAGSIGTIAVHQEYSKMLAEEGIGVTVVRSGKYKALGNPMEKLSDLGQSVLQGQVDYMAAMFDKHVADARGTTVEVVKSKMGEGRVFVGQQAVDANIADDISNFDAVVSKIQGGIDSRNARPKYGVTFQQGAAVPKTALTEQQIAAMAAGGVAADAGTAAGEPVAPQVAADTSVEPAPAAPAADAAKEQPAAPAADAGVVSYLQTQLSEANAKVLELTIKARDAEAQVNDLKGSQASMRSIVGASLDNMRVALGGSKGSYDAMSDAQLLAEHANVRAQFEKKFVAGGVAVPPADATARDQSEPAVDPQRAARLRASRPTATK